jgi:hypothetical protein
MGVRSRAPVAFAAVYLLQTETRNGCTNPGFEEATIGNQPESLRSFVSIVAEGYRPIF